MMNRRLMCLALPAAALALSGCGLSEDEAEVGEFGLPKSQPVSVEAIKAHATGLSVGQLVSAREVFVFFDPQCPHCAMFWRETEPLLDKLRFTWIPVAIIGKDSLKEGAAFLEAQDKQAALKAHSEKVIAALGQSKMPPRSEAATPAPQLRALIAKNTRLMDSFGATGVPYVVLQGGKGIVARTGGMTREDVLAAFSAPAA